MPELRNPAFARGVTLVELVIVIMLLGILGVVGSSMIADSFKVTQRVDSNNASEAAARYAMERIAHELREMKYEGTSSGYSSLADYTGMAAPVSVTVSDISFCRNIASVATTVSFRKEGSDLKIGYSNGCPSPRTTALSAPANVLLSGVSAFTLSFYDATRTPVNPVSSIRTSTAFVAIDLTVNNDGQALAQRVWVALRNQ